MIASKSFDFPCPGRAGAVSQYVTSVRLTLNGIPLLPLLYPSSSMTVTELTEPAISTSKLFTFYPEYVPSTVVTPFPSSYSTVTNSM